MTGHLEARDRARMSRSGYIPMTTADGLALFDAALAQGPALVMPARFDLGIIRARSGAGPVPPMFQGLIRPTRRVASAAAGTEASADLRQRLVAMSHPDRERELLGVIRANAAAVLGHDSVDAVGADQEFKALGFDSLGAVELRNRLTAATGLSLSTTAVFDHPTSATLARHLASALQTGPERDHREDDDRIGSDRWPLAGCQRDIVAVGARYPDLPVAQIVANARLAGTVDVERMRECFRRTCARHDALRLRLEPAGAEIVQYVGAHPPDIEFVDFTGESDPAAACTRWISMAGDCVLPREGPLIRAAVLVDRPDSFLVYACFHHAVTDAWGIKLALGDLVEDYAADTEPDSDVPEPGRPDAPSYLDFVRADLEYRRSPEWEADRRYFRESYRGVEPALFVRTGSPVDRRREHRSVRVSAEDARRVRDTGHSVFAVTAAAIGEYLRRVHRGDDIVIGVPFLNRSSEDQLRTVGCLVNMVPLRIPVDLPLSIDARAELISTQIWELQARQRFAHGDLIAALHEGTGAPLTLFDVTFSYLTVPDSAHAERIWRNSSLLSSGYSLDAVNIVVRDYERDGALEADLFYATDVFDGDYRFADALRHVMTLITNASANPHVPLSKIDMLSTEDRTVLDAFSRGGPISV